MEKEKKQLEAAVTSLKETNATLEAKIEASQKATAELRVGSSDTTNTGHIAKLDAGVKAVLQAIDGEQRVPNSVEALRKIEKKFEDLFKIIAEAEIVTPDVVQKLERSKEMDRRDKLRLSKLLEQQSKNEARLRQSMLRAEAPIFKKIGKQLMFRSKPFNVTTEESEEDEETKAAREAVTLFGISVDLKTNTLIYKI